MVNTRTGTGTTESNKPKSSPQQAEMDKATVAGASKQRTSHVISFGPFTLDRANAVLHRNNRVIALTPKAFSVLCYLVDRAGQLVTKEAIFAAVWPKSVVTDSALTVCIREIRKALGDVSKNPCYIETAHKRGYRFIGRICHLSQSDLSRSPSSPCVVGRDLPLSGLQACYERSITGDRQLVFVTGEAGIGKTTLLETFIKDCLDHGDCQIIRGQCIEHYGTGEAYLPLLDALGRLCRNHDEDLLDLLRHTAPSWLMHLPSLQRQFELAGAIQANAVTSPDRMMREMAEALEAISQRRPLVLCLEDLHWADLSTLDLLSFLARRHDSAQLLTIGTFRPVDAIIQNQPLRNLQQDLLLRGRCTHLPLEFFTLGDIAEYLAAGYPDNSFPTDFARIIHQQSDGNPLFVVNILEDLKNTGLLMREDECWRIPDNLSAIRNRVPDNLKAMITQQIESLDHELRTLLEAASVASEPGGIAVQFTVSETAGAAGLDELAIEPCFEKLARDGHFLRGLGVTEWPNGEISCRYEFTHGLYQNVLYERVSPTRKVKLHRCLGQRLEQSFAERSTEIANALAIHFELGRDFPSALRYLDQSARIATQRGASREAVHILTKARQLLEKIPPSESRDRQELFLLQSLGPSLTASVGNAAPEIEICYLRAIQLCETLDEKTEQFPALFGLRSYYLIVGRLSNAHELAETLLKLAETLDNKDFLLEAHVGLASTFFFSGNFKASHHHAMQGIERYRQAIHCDHAALYGIDPGVFCRVRAGQTLWILGYPDQALEYERCAVSLAETLNHPYSHVFAIHNLTQVYLCRGDRDAALACADEGKKLAEKHGFSFLSSWALYLNAWALALSQDVDAARSEIEEALHASNPESGAADSYLDYFLAETYQNLADYKSSLSVLAQPVNEHIYDAERLRVQGECLLAQEPEAYKNRKTVDKAEGLFKKALEISRRQSAKSFELRTAMSLGKLLMKVGQEAQAYQLLKSVYHHFNEGLGTHNLQEAAHLLEEFHSSAERTTSNSLIALVN